MCSHSCKYALSPQNVVPGPFDCCHCRAGAALTFFPETHTLAIVWSAVINAVQQDILLKLFCVDPCHDIKLSLSGNPQSDVI